MIEYIFINANIVSISHQNARQENIKYNQDAEESAIHLKQIRADAKSALLSWQQKENRLRME